MNVIDFYDPPKATVDFDQQIGTGWYREHRHRQDKSGATVGIEVKNYEKLNEGHGRKG